VFVQENLLNPVQTISQRNSVKQVTLSLQSTAYSLQSIFLKPFYFYIKSMNYLCPACSLLINVGLNPVNAGCSETEIPIHRDMNVRGFPFTLYKLYNFTNFQLFNYITTIQNSAFIIQNFFRVRLEKMEKMDT